VTAQFAEVLRWERRKLWLHSLTDPFGDPPVDLAWLCPDHPQDARGRVC
jgi:hypothetical protein